MKILFKNHKNLNQKLKEYFDKEKYNPTINKGADENDKK